MTWGQDRVLDRAGRRVQVVGAVHLQGPESAVQAGQVGGTVGRIGRSRCAAAPRADLPPRRTSPWCTGRSAPPPRTGTRSRRRRCPPHAAPGRRTGDGSAGPPFSWATLASWVRITEPTRTPLSWASVKDASTSRGSDGSGIRPESSITIRGSCPGGTSFDQGVLGIDRFPAGRAAERDGESRWHRRHRHGVRQPGQLRQRRPAIDDDVVAVPGGEPGRAHRGAAACGRRGQHEPARQGHEHA